MKPSERMSRSRLARAVGLLVVLGLPLAAVSPLAPGMAPSSSVDQLASSRATDTGATSSPVVQPDGYTAATPRHSGGGAYEVEVRHSAPSAADPVTTIVNDPRCGPGFTSAAITGETAFSCFHSTPDPLPEIGRPLAQAASAAPVCLGNGVNGPRIQLVYMYVEGQPDRTAQVVPRIANDIAPRMEGVFRETSKLQGREIGMRLHMPGCKLSVDTLMIDEVNGEPDDTGRMLTRITRHLARAGYDSTDRKYIVWFDGGNRGACGVAPFPPTAFAPHATDNAAVGAAQDMFWQQETLSDAGVGRETVIAFRYGMPVLGDFPGATECWGQGGTGARTEIHELIHVLGAVNLGAPNSNGLGHCTDDHDIMCYGEAGVSTVPRCATPIEQLDCGADDYFNARPSAGSYLSTHWNTANSRFLGDALVHDAVPVEIPRP